MERSMIKELKTTVNCIKNYLNKDVLPNRFFNMTQYHIIGYLLKHEGEDVCQKDLEEETGLKKASITGALDALTEKDIVARVQSKDDRRKNYIVLTEKANDFRKKLEERENSFSELITKDISDEEKEIFFTVLQKIRSNVMQTKSEDLAE